MCFVEDDDQVRRAIVGLPAADGWAVDATGVGDRAIEALEDVDWSDDVVVTDVVIPGVDGWEIAGRVRESRPETPVVLVSGFDFQEVQDAIEGRTAMLRKPFTITELNATIIWVLWSKGGPGRLEAARFDQHSVSKPDPWT